MRLRVLLGEADGAKHYAEHGEANMLRACRPGARRPRPGAPRPAYRRCPARAGSRGCRPADRDTRPRAVAPSGNLVSCQRWQSILRRCDLPLP